MKKTFAYLFLPALLFLFTNCGPTLKLQSVEVLPTIEVEDVTEIAADSNYILSGKKYSFPNRVNEVQYAPQWQQMAVNYNIARRWPVYSIYDVEQEKLNWAKRGDYVLAMLQKDITMVSYQSKKILIETENSLPIRWVDGEEFAVIDDSVTLKFTERFSRIDLKTGSNYWSRPEESNYQGWLSDELDGDWMYVIANGLHGFNLNDGKGWYHQAKTNYDASRGGRALANTLMVGLNILSAAFGGYAGAFPYLEPLRAHNIHAKPKFDGDDLYFADRKDVYCLNKTTGESYWEQTMETELGVSALEVLSKNDLLLIGKGYRYVNFELDKDKQALLYLMDTNNGEIINQRELPKDEIIINHAINNAFIYLLTSSEIYQFDYQLEQLKKINLPSQYGAPVRVVTWSSSRYDADLQTDIPDFPLVIRTMQGVVALHPVTLEELWYKRLGSIIQDMPPVISSDRWQLPILVKEIDLRRSWVDEYTETFWFAKSGKIIGLDLINDGATVAEFDLPSDDFWFVGEGELVQFGGRDVRILQLKAN